MLPIRRTPQQGQIARSEQREMRLLIKPGTATLRRPRKERGSRGEGEGPHRRQVRPIPLPRHRPPIAPTDRAARDSEKGKRSKSARPLQALQKRALGSESTTDKEAGSRRPRSFRRPVRAPRVRCPHRNLCRQSTGTTLHPTGPRSRAEVRPAGTTSSCLAAHRLRTASGKSPGARQRGEPGGWR